MTASQKLSIVIPTYNRSGFLDFFFELHIPRVQKHKIPIYISDCNSPDDTRLVVEKWQKEYEYIYYACAEETVHPDKNAKNAVDLSNTEYTWLVGDSYELPEASIDRVMDLISSTETPYDVITLNLVGRLNEIDSQLYEKCNDVLTDLAWMMACVSCNIYHRRIVDGGDQLKYAMSCFCQLGFILDFLAGNTFRLYWAKDIMVETLKHPTLRKKGWGDQFFPIMFQKWPEFISNLPKQYNEEARSKSLKALPERTLLLGWRNVLHLRAEGFLNTDIYKEYHPTFEQVASESFDRYARFLTRLPQKLCKLTITIIEWYRRRCYRTKKALGLTS